jgi:hypothetical protein
MCSVTLYPQQAPDFVPEQLFGQLPRPRSGSKDYGVGGNFSIARFRFYCD